MTGTFTPASSVSTSPYEADRASLTVLCRADQVRVVREFVRRTLGDDPRAAESVLLASELSTNSVRHSRSRLGGAMTITVDRGRDGIIRVEVTDAGGGAVPVLRDGADGWGDGGRGLRLVRSLCQQWGYRVEPDGHLVHDAAAWPGRRVMSDGGSLKSVVTSFSPD